MKSFNVVNVVFRILIAIYILFPVATALSLQLIEANNWLLLLGLTTLYVIVSTVVNRRELKGGMTSRTRVFIRLKLKAYVALSFTLGLCILSGIPTTKLHIALFISTGILYLIWTTSRDAYQSIRYNSTTPKRLMEIMVFFFVTFITISTVIANFANSQMVWTSALAILFLSYSLIRNSDFVIFNIRKLQADDNNYIAVVFVSLLALGTLSTIWQFHSVELFLGINVLQLTLSSIALIVIIIAFFILNSFRMRIKNKAMARKLKEERDAERQKEEDTRLELKRQALADANERKMALKIQKKEIKSKITSNMEYKLKDLIEVSNLKNQIVWGQEMSLALEVCYETMSKSFNDNDLLKTIRFLNSILAYIANQKTSDLVYEGEVAIKDQIKEALNFIANEDARKKLIPNI